MSGARVISRAPDLTNSGARVKKKIFAHVLSQPPYDVYLFCSGRYIIWCDVGMSDLVYPLENLCSAGNWLVKLVIMIFWEGEM